MPLPKIGSGWCWWWSSAGRQRLSSGRRLPAPALGHEGVELLAILRALELLDEFGEHLRFFVELAAFLLEPLEFPAAILVEREVAAGRVGGAGRRDAVAQEAEVLLDEFLPV